MRGGILILFQNLVGRLLAFHHWVTFTGCDFVINGFYYVENCSLYAQFGDSFYHGWILNSIKCFFCIYWDDLVVLVFFVDAVYHVDWFAYIKLSLQSWNKVNLIIMWFMIHFMYCWIWFANILLRIFAFTSIKDASVSECMFSRSVMSDSLWPHGL